MATLAKKIYMKNSAGTQQTALIYGTTGESGTPYMYASDGSTTGYVPLCSTSDARATSGRVTKGGTTYAIANLAIPAYTRKTFSTAGSGTFTVPSGVTKIRVTCVGGGAGGCSGFKIPSATVGSTATTAVAGGTTKFGSVSAAGGTSVILKNEGCVIDVSPCGDDGCEKRENYLITQLSTGYHNGTLSTSDDAVSGGAAVPLTDKDGTTVFSAGAGGYADSGNLWIYTASEGCPTSEHISYQRLRVHSGASGSREVSTITVTPGQSISYTVGAGGKWYRKGSNAYFDYTWGTDGNHGSPGNAGGILIEYGRGV